MADGNPIAFIPAEHPDPFSEVGGSQIGRRYNLPCASIPHVGQVAKDAVEKKSRFRGEQAGDIPEEREPGLQVPKHSNTLGPEVALVGAGAALPGGAVGLAGEPARDDNRERTTARKDCIAGDGGHVPEIGNVGKPLGQKGAGIGLDLGKADGAERWASMLRLGPWPFPFPWRAFMASVHVSHSAGVLFAPMSFTAGVGHNGLEGEGEATLIAREQIKDRDRVLRHWLPPLVYAGCRRCGDRNGTSV